VQQSHTNATNIYRGAGRPEACLLMERLMDEAATKLGIDPLEIRLKNFIRADQMPFKTAAGQTLDSGDFAALLKRCAEVFGYSSRRQTQISKSTRINGIAKGLGIACFTEPCGTGFESATVRLHRDGSVEVLSGSADQGQGHSASYAQIAALALGCSPSAVRVIEGDTTTCPPGVGALASRSIAIGGSAVLQAAQAVLALQKNPNAVYPLEASVNYSPVAEAWSAGCTMAEVAIDVETGEVDIVQICMVDDAGRIISPKLAHGQLLGGAAQGLGQAMMERLVYSSAGQLLTGSLMDYAIPRASDMPPISISHLPTHTNANLLQAKGVGEAGTIGVPAAILNAVCDALKQHDANIDTTQLSFPLTSEKIWNVLQSA
jgi:carbon-monoxide dehydrogenase large subunit